MENSELRRPCKRGNLADRSKSGHCLCAACKAFRHRPTPRKAAYKAAWNAKNPEKLAAYTRKYIDAHPQKRRETELGWRRRNPEKVAAMNAKAGRKWAATNKGQRLASVRARQLALRQRMPVWADKERIQAFYLEAQRLTAETGIPHEVDHIIPLQGERVSGLHVPENLQVIPRSLNRRKRNVFEVSA